MVRFSVRYTENGQHVLNASSLVKRIPLTTLIQTLAVAEHLSFRHAALALGVSQSSVSARIKLLEEALGVFLFERRPRGVKLTEAGRHFVEQIAVGIDQIDHALRTAGMTARGEQGTLRIGVHAMFPSGFFANLLRHYRERHPGVDAEIVEANARETVLQVRDGRLDVAFVTSACFADDCHSRPLWTEALMAAIPASHSLAKNTSVSWTDLAAETFLIRHGCDGAALHDHIRLRLAAHKASPSVLRFNVDRLTLMSMVGQGYGVSFANEAIAEIQIPGVVFLRVLDEPKPVVFSAVWSASNRNPALRALLNLAQTASRSASST